MIRRRLLWFTIGFASASAAMGQFIFRDLWADRTTVSSQVIEKFSALDARVKNLEVFPSNSISNVNEDGTSLK